MTRKPSSVCVSVCVRFLRINYNCCSCACLMLALTPGVEQLEATLRRIEAIAVGMEDGARGEEQAAAPKGGVTAIAARLKGGSKKINSVYPL
jgi:hypothetical protein